jgi:Acetyltransferase (isoleucine patch superfamily)
MFRTILYKVRRRLGYYMPRIRGQILTGRKNIFIEHDVCIPFPESIVFNGSSEIKAYCRLSSTKKNKILLGNNTIICSYTTLETAGGIISLGNNIIVGEYSTIQGQGDVIIEDDVLLASHVHFISNHHEYLDVNLPIKYQPCTAKKILVQKNTWIGINVTILSGVTIGKHCIIGSGSIVKNDIPDYSVAVGNPARVVKKFNFNTNEWTTI